MGGNRVINLGKIIPDSLLKDIEDLKSQLKEQKLKITNCPNCGAPIEKYYSHNCKYCNTYLNFENEDKFPNLYETDKTLKCETQLN